MTESTLKYSIETHEFPKSHQAFEALAAAAAAVAAGKAIFLRSESEAIFMFLWTLSMKSAAFRSIPGSATHRTVSSSLRHTLLALGASSFASSLTWRFLFNLNKLKTENLNKLKTELFFCLLLLLLLLRPIFD